MAEVKTYCFLHVYYEELVEETMGYVNNIPNLNKIFVNIPDVSEDNEDRYCIEAKFHHADDSAGCFSLFMII